MYVYTFIRKDLPINHQIVQACHSALEAGSDFKESGEIPNLVLIELKDVNHLYETEKLLTDKGIRFHNFFEPDNGIGHSSITTEPIDREKRKALSNYRLWRA